MSRPNNNKNTANLSGTDDDAVIEYGTQAADEPAIETQPPVSMVTPHTPQARVMPLDPFNRQVNGPSLPTLRPAHEHQLDDETVPITKRRNISSEARSIGRKVLYRNPELADLCHDSIVEFDKDQQQEQQQKKQHATKLMHQHHAPVDKDSSSDDSVEIVADMNRIRGQNAQQEQQRQQQLQYLKNQHEQQQLEEHLQKQQHNAASYADGYYPEPRSVSRNILPTSAQGKKSADTPSAETDTTNPSNVPAHGQVRQQTQGHDDGRGSGGGGRIVGGRGFGSRDSGGRVKYPRGPILGDNPRQEWEDNHVQPPRPVRGQDQRQGQGQGQGRGRGQGQGQRHDSVRVLNDRSDWNVFNASRTNNQQRYQWSLIAFGDDTPQSNDLRYTLANGSSIGAIVPHINETELHVLDVQTMAAPPV